MDDGKAPAALVEQRALARQRAKRWTPAIEQRFFEELAATANVRHSAGVVGFRPKAVHDRKRSNPVFAAEWRRALEAGYAELEALVLRQALGGSTRTEQVHDGDGKLKQTKTVHQFSPALAMRLLQAHRAEVERFRAMEAVHDPHNKAVVDHIREELAQVRQRLAEGLNGEETDA